MVAHSRSSTVPGGSVSGARADDPDAILELFLSFWVARTVMAAVEMGVFDLLRGEGLPELTAATALGLKERPARGLFDTCVSVGLLSRTGDHIHATPAAEKFLSSDSEYTLRNYVLDERWCWPAWGRLEEALRNDAPPLPQDEDGYHEFPEEFLLDFLHGHSLWMGEKLAAAVPLEGVRKIIDIGGGSGAISIALCRANPSLNAVVIDREQVLAKTAEHIAKAGLTDRIATHPANFFSDPLPEGCDAAVIANLLHDFSIERASEILRRAAEALPSGGRLLVLDISPDDDRNGPVLPAVFTVAMIVNTETGVAHTRAELRAMLEDTGFAVERVETIGDSYVTVAIEARKR
jgi:ubiquinone/menaquinone biosynthesis C-methylase UbiE